jgi:RNA polymerase subunit RPABC4/transcription elongation factor Spt4
MTNGIRIFSPDNATWGPVTQDTVSLDWLGMFDLIVTLPEFSVTGSGADTLGLGGSVMMGTGLPPGFDEFSRWIQVETHVEDIGKTICIDSAFYPPSGAWYWNWSGRGSTVPEWSGPHCYTIVETTDVDGDGIPDHLDNCLTVFNPDQINSDNDSYGDACDNCPTVYNPDQMNSDNDSYGDACDNCPTVINPDQMNSDNDSYGDACDNCDLVANEDQTNSDPDSHGDACDNCDLVANEDQTNSDTDSHGDACDNCDLVANEDQADYNDDGTGNACDCCAIRGDVDHGGESEPNITDLIYLVTYMFQGGPAPVCNDPNSPACPEHYYAETDIDGNGSCTPDITDLIYLVTYMFQKGPALVPCP